MKMIFFKGISNCHIQGSKFGGKFYKFGGKSVKKLNSAEFMEFVFSKSASVLYIILLILLYKDIKVAGLLF